jgi:23S rRNA (guanosine2251-2'-O)-methyltransferase
VKEQNFTWIIGKNALKEAIATETPLQKVFLQENLEKETLYELLKLCRKHKISVVQVPKQKIDKLCPKQHQGVLGMINPIRFHDPQDLVSTIFEQGKSPCLLFLDGISDVRNFGAIARSAEVFGIDGIILTRKNSAAINEEAIKASAGALLNIPICQATNSVIVLKNLKRMGLSLISCTEKATQSLRKTELNIPVVFILGSEGVGISPELVEISDVHIAIPQSGQINSLNVSVAAGIICYEWYCNSNL